MLKKSDKLFDFVQAMTAHERGYFKQSSNKDSYYVILFDVLCKLKEYDEEEVVAEMRKRGCKRKLTAMKDYLWRELTQAMAPYHLIKTPLGEAMAKMQALHLMLNKGLTTHIIKELETLKKFCVKYELYETWLHTLQFEFKFGFHQHLLNDSFWKQFHEAVEINMLYMQLSEIQHRLYVYVLRHKNLEANSAIHNEMKLLMEHPVLHDKKYSNMLRMSIARESVYDLYAHLSNNYNGMIEHNMRIAELLEKNPHLIKDGREISMIYTNIAVALANAGQRKKLAHSIDEIIQKLHQIPYHHTYTVARELEVKVLRMLALNSFNQIDILQEFFREHYQRIPVSVKHHLYYHFSIANYKAGKNNDALDWINEAQTFYRKHKLLSDNNMNQLKMLQLFIHFDAGNMMYVRNQTETFLRCYITESKEHDPIYLVLKSLKKLSVTPDNKTELQKLHDKLSKTNLCDNNTILLNPRLWVESKLNRMSFSQFNNQQAMTELM